MDRPRVIDLLRLIETLFSLSLSCWRSLLKQNASFPRKQFIKLYKAHMTTDFVTRGNIYC